MDVTRDVAMRKARIYWRRGEPILPIIGEISAANFLRLVDQRGERECWSWLGAADRYGYGMFKLGQHVRLGAHRLAYVLAKDEPGLLHVCHSCDNPLCCNPAH